MIQRILIVLILFGQIACGQKGQLTKISGTKCSLIPPDNFVPSTTFSGFQNPELGASIMINEIPAPFQSIVEGFTEDALKSKGMTLESKKTIDFNNSKALMINVTQLSNGTKYIKQMLVFGDTKTTVLVNGIYPEVSKDIEDKIKEALLSTVYNVDQNDNPLDAAKFSINIDNTDFKLVKYISGSLLYSTDGKIPTEKPTLIVGNSIAKVTSENRKRYAEERLKKLPRGELNTIKEFNDISIDNLNGYEIVADGKDKNGNNSIVYQVILFDDFGDYYIINGNTNVDFDKYIETYKKVSKTFKRKK